MKKQSTSQASWSILSEGVSASRVESHIVRSHVNQMVEAIKAEPGLAEHIYRVCGDNFEAIPKHLSKLERALDRTNYALITMGSDWYRQRLTHEDREMVDMAAKYNPTPFPSTSKQSEKRMRSASFGDIIIEVIETYEDELMELDPEYLMGDETDDWTAKRKFESLHGGDIDTALLYTSDRRVKEVLMTIQSDLERIGTGELSMGRLRRRASDVIRGLEKRIARLEKQSANPNLEPLGKWVSTGDNQKKEIVTTVPTKTRIDVGPRDYDYTGLLLQLAKVLSPRDNGTMYYRKMKADEIKVHLFKKVAELTETVPVTRGYPDGGATFILYEAYYQIPMQKKAKIKVYLQVEELLEAGGSLVHGKLLTKSQANNFISRAKEKGYDINNYL